jgi:hypothetical protein
MRAGEYSVRCQTCQRVKMPQENPYGDSGRLCTDLRHSKGSHRWFRSNCQGHWQGFSRARATGIAGDADAVVPSPSIRSFATIAPQHHVAWSTVWLEASTREKPHDALSHFKGSTPAEGFK